MDPSMQPISEYSKVTERLAALGKKFGFELEAVHIIPPRQGSPVFVQLGFHVTDLNEQEMLNAGKITGDDEFDVLIAGAEKAEDEQMRDSLREEYESGSGLFEGFGEEDRT